MTTVDPGEETHAEDHTEAITLGLHDASPPDLVEAMAKDLSQIADHDLAQWFGGYVRGVLPEADRV